MKRPVNAWAIASAICVIGIVLFVHFLPLCEEEVVSEQTSPDGKYVAVLMTRNCGATTGFVDHVNLKLVGSKLTQNFLTGTIKTDEVFAAEKKMAAGVGFRWVGPRILEIDDVPQDGRRQQSWRDVMIQFAPWSKK